MTKQQRIATVNYLGFPMEIDVDQNWQRLLEDTEPNRVAQVSTDWHFLIHLGSIEMPYAIKTRFFKYFTAPAAIKARDVAIDGLVAFNYENELNLLQGAARFQNLRTAGKYKDDPEQAHIDMIGFAVGFAEIVQRRDVSALRRMIAIMENKGKTPDGERGGVGSAEGYMLEKFAELHIATRSLPTKKALRDACGLGKLQDEKLASKRMNKLGLRGLPTEPEI